MKKITMLMLLAIMVLPMSAKISTTIAPYQAHQSKVANYLASRNGLSPKVIVATDHVATLKAVAPKEDGTYAWDFEDADAGLSPFTVEDKDGDGFNWTYYNNTGLTSGRMTAHEGEGLIASASYDNDSGTALHPNNWLISPEFTLGGFLKFWAAGQDASYAAEVFGVYVSVDGETWTQVGTDKTATGDYVEYEFDLSSYAGQTGKFAIVHHNVTDMFFLNIDDITFNPSGEVTPEPTLPINLTAEPTATNAKISWTAGENNGSWDLRWRPYVDPALASMLWDLPLDGYQAQIAEWGVYDADGDGYGWGLAYSSSANDDVCFYSASYDSDNWSALNPDNWLFTPEVGLGGTLKFKCKNASASYLDKLMVYVCDNPEWETTDEFVAISDFIQPGTTWTEYEFDLSDYEGTGIIAFRHYDSYDMMAIYIDDIEVIPENAVEIPEWTLVSGATNPYTIEGLTPETEYEVQVMAYNEEGDKYTDWTESTNFTTLAEGGETGMTEFYLVGTFNEWNQTEEGGRIAFVEDEEGNFVATNVALEEGAEFKIITPAEDGGWIWFGGQHEGTDYFLVMPEYYHNGTAITLVPNDPEGKGNFKMEYGPAVYKITLKAEVPTTGEGIAPKALTEPLVMVMEKTTAIETINVENTVKSGRYNLLGQPVNENYKGIVIENGVKKIQK